MRDRLFGHTRADHQQPANKIRVPELQDFFYAVTMRFRPAPAANVNVIVAQVGEQILTSIEDRDPVTGKWSQRPNSAKTHPSLLDAQKLALGHIRSELVRMSVVNDAPKTVLTAVPAIPSKEEKPK